MRVCVGTVCQHRSEKSSLNGNFQLFYRLQSTVHAGGRSEIHVRLTSDVFSIHSTRWENYCAVRYRERGRRHELNNKTQLMRFGAF